jgi:hypothetical protein
MRIDARRIFIMALLCAGAGLAAAAQEAEATKALDPRHQGFYYGFPAYLYGTSSASGAQLGYQLGKLHFRLDASLVADTRDGEAACFANPSIGVFYSEDWESKIRTYQGLAFGIQKGIWRSFDGVSCFLNFLTGAEWFAFERKAIYIEIGSGMAGPAKEGAFQGGTIIGGGVKCFF